MYMIGDGVHRSLIAWHLGEKTIRARDTYDADATEIPLSELRSQRRSNNIDQVRLCECLDLRRKGVVLDPIGIFHERDYSGLNPTTPELRYPDLSC